ncbi:ABC transporter ATP-binding protein [Paenarthrobacter sp. 2TAF44]|uniref:ABC transporter ATP-binding protein n=1 Tax=Paenarthrobacter sp. 2TAF44 TaxID=3233018 RepID=UPI003F96E99F
MEDPLNRGKTDVPLIELTDLSKTYPGVVPVVALSPTRLRIYEGDQIAIVGPSGSGKSTLLNMLGLLDAPTVGSYKLQGVEVAVEDDLIRGTVRGQRFGFVFQAFHLLAGRTLAENVELGMVYANVKPKERVDRATRALERLGLGHRAHADPRHLSGGERQRAAIARAIAMEPRVLFCDEPTGNLDSKNTRLVMDLLDGLNESGLTVVMVTHDQHLAQQMKRCITVQDGVINENESLQHV